ncbi:hypothetical protein [uncultured Brevundimonas sp.]|uniref:hypothetical protein n=1 Tax=uncultured Brevundimonas sp. TaxID=213418 RepID=UPI0025D7ACB4|nr:hypothetical protein [uncultured Brevundimonas sp.]
MTADIDPGKIQIGGFNDNRAYWLVNGTWIPLETLLRSRPGEITRSAHRETYYPIAWLLTHWFFSDDEHQDQLRAYLHDVMQGGDPVEAMETATGMKLSGLQAELRRYMKGRLTVRNIIGSAFPAVDVAVTRLPHSANDLLLINQRLTIGVPNEDRKALREEVARLAVRYGEDSLSLWPPPIPTYTLATGRQAKPHCRMIFLK